jgi:hypothetical protein
MQGLFFEQDAGVHLVIRGLVVLIGFWTAWCAGTAVAEGWSSYRLVVAYTFLLAWAMQFLHHALFNSPMFSGFYYVLDFVLLLVVSMAGFRYRRTYQIVTGYYWLYEKTSLFSWRQK